MANVGVIDIALRANTEKWTKGLKTASDGLHVFVGGISDGVTKIGAFGAAIAGTAVVGGLVALTKNSLAAIDEQGELASRLGVTGGALAAFGHAVQMTGGPTEDLPVILGKLSATLGEAATDGGKAAEALEGLGLDAKALADAGPIEAMKQIGDKIGKIASPAEQAARAVELFGKKGPELLDTLRAGSSGLGEFEAELGSFGGVLDEVGYGKVATANDALDRMGAAVSGVGTQLAVQLSPFVESAVVKLTELGTAGGGVGPIITKAIDLAVGGVGLLADGANLLKIAFLGAQTGITIGLSAIVKGIAWVGEGLEALLNMIPGVEVSFGTALKDISRGLDDLAVEQAGRLNAAIEAPRPSTAMKAYIDDLRKGAEATTAAVVDTVKAIDDTGPLNPFEGIMKALDDFKDSPSDKFDPTARAGALAAGSQEARSAILAFRGGSGGGEDGKKTAENTGKAARGIDTLVAEFRKFAIRSAGYDEPELSI